MATVCRWIAFGVVLAGLAGRARGDETRPVAVPAAGGQAPSLGGLQVWTDERICGSYRIQRHVTIGYYRLLDATETCLAWGSYEHCSAALDEASPPKSRKPPGKRVVLVLHGLGLGRSSMNALGDFLREHGTDDVVQIGYASTREDIGAHAKSLDRVVRGLEGVEEIDIVAFSMGNLVVRYWLGDVAAAAAAEAPAGAPRLPRLRRCVMIGPPNHGAERASLWSRSAMGREVFELILGDSGSQLGPRFHEIENHLAIPPGEFGIIAGGRGNGEGWHVDIPGDDDGTVGVAETKLAGAADFIVIPVRHNDLVNDERAMRMTASFLRDGFFQTASARRPIPR